MASSRQITCVYCVTFCEVMIQFWIILFLSAPRQDVSISEYGISTKKLSVTYVWCRDTKMPKFKGEFYISWKRFFCQKWEILNVFFISLKNNTRDSLYKMYLLWNWQYSWVGLIILIMVGRHNGSTLKASQPWIKNLKKCMLSASFIWLFCDAI